MWRCLLLLMVVLAGCSAPAPTPVASPAPLPTAQQIPPTFTPDTGAPRSQPTAASSPAPTRTTTAETPIPFDHTVVELRYQIPAIDLDRRLQGNAASQLLLVDETAAEGQQRNNQGGVLLQLQQALEALSLEPVPDGCDRCVHLSFSLPLIEEETSGWLQDPALLASIENLMTVTLGPHFPPGTAVGLHRSASPFAPAQTLAVTEAGTRWVWQANQGMIPEPETAVSDPLDTPAQLDVDTLADSYTATCPGVPQEQLFLQTETTTRRIAIACPQFSLPTTLLPLYLSLDAVMMAKLTDNLPQPPAAFPLDALLNYRRADGAQLTLYQDGTAVAVAANNTPMTDTVAVSDVISLTTNLIDAGVVQTGLTTFAADGEDAETAVRVLVRGPAGVYDGAWQDSADIPALSPLDDLLDRLLPTPAATPTP